LVYILILAFVYRGHAETSGKWKFISTVIQNDPDVKEHIENKKYGVRKNPKFDEASRVFCPFSSPFLRLCPLIFLGGGKQTMFCEAGFFLICIKDITSNT